MYRFAVIGHPISHSLSPQIHQRFASQANLNISYEAINIVAEDLQHFLTLELSQFDGINITAPHKEAAYLILKKLHYQANIWADTIQAVNTVNVTTKQIINTDSEGFMIDLLHKFGSVNGKNILILGAGGASKAIIPAVINQSPLSVYLWNRSTGKVNKLSHLYPNIIPFNPEQHQQKFDLLINCTSSKSADQPIHVFQNHVSHETFYYDLMYSRDKLTPFLQQLHKLYPDHSQVCNGLGMLINQAAIAFQNWTSFFPNKKIKL